MNAGSSDYFKRRKINEKIVNDIVHGIIKLPLHILEIVDTTEFQRLRWISQMGFNQFVYPTSTGSRFEHSIGSFHLASMFCRQIQNQISEDRIDLKITETEIKCVEIAALCHDLGFGPYSQAWQDEIIPLLNITKEHRKTQEELSFEIFSYVVNNTKVADYSPQRTNTIKETIGLRDNDMDLIKRIIVGKYDREKDKGKKFLFEIVSNKESGLDVHTFDCLCRDTTYLGWSNKNKIHDIKRIMHFMRVIRCENKDWCLALRDKEIFSVHEIFYSRHMLNRYASQHKTVKSIDCMFKDAMKTVIENEDHLRELIENVIGVTKDEKLKEIVEGVIGEMRNGDWKRNGMKCVLYSKEFISKCCDFHIWNIMSKHASHIVRNINERNLYRLYCQVKITRKSNDTKKSKKANKDSKQKENKNDEKSQSTSKADKLNVEVGCENDDCCFDNIDILTEKDKFIKTLEEVFQTSLKKHNIKNSIKITISNFSLGENNENPLGKLPFYRRDQIDKCFTFDNDDHKMPDLTNLIFEENVMMIFTEYEIENRNEKNVLNDVITDLCKDQDEKSQDVVFVYLRKNYKFTKN